MKSRMHIAALGLSTSILLAINGCTLLNPHVSWDSVAEAKIKNETAHKGSGQLSKSNTVNRYSTMQDAVAYADRAISAYKRGMGDQAALNSMTGVVLIPVTATIIGLGIKGGHTSSITNLSVGAAAGYGMSTWLSNPSRGEIYAAGVLAVNCAKQVMLPYYVSDTWTSEYFPALNDLSNQERTLALQLTELNFLISELERLSLADIDRLEVMKAKAQIVIAKGLLADTSITRQKGFVLKRRLELAGQTLVFVVDRIAGEVDKALLSTVPSLTALPGIIASLTPATDMFRQAPRPAEVSSKDEPDLAIDAQALRSLKYRAYVRNALVHKAQEVMNNIARLNSAEAVISTAVADFDQPVSPTALAECGVTADDIIQPLRVLPSNRITMKAGEIKSVFLTGGSGQYAATATSEIEGLSVSQPVLLGETVRIVSTAGMPSTQTHVLVKDVSGQTSIIELTISASKKEDSTRSSVGSNNSLTSFERSLGLNEIQQIQTALRICNTPSSLKIDGILGDDTRAAAKQCAHVGSEVLDRGKVEALTGAYLTDGLPNAKPMTRFEKQATIDDLTDVYTKLGISSVPTSQHIDDWFTKEFRSTLKAFQQTHDADSANKIGISGLYTNDFPE